MILARMIHELATPTVDMNVLPGVLGPQTAEEVWKRTETSYRTSPSTTGEIRGSTGSPP
jgi:hypothetical protein